MKGTTETRLEDMRQRDVGGASDERFNTRALSFRASGPVGLSWR